MAISVNRRQGPGFRKWFLIGFLLTPDFWLSTPAHARDFGVHGTIADIEEEDPIAFIQRKLKTLEDSGELEKHAQELTRKTREAVERPKPIAGLLRALETRVFYKDPTYVVPKDLKDHRGQAFAKKGTRINPLETVSMVCDLLFFDGDDPDQKAWVEEQLGEVALPHPMHDSRRRLKLILVKGAPLKLAETWKQVVFFDQGGIITKKLGIKHVPARVSQEGLRLRITEVRVESKS